MDNFMDKISQKLNSQEIIRANAAADAAALENLERQVNLFKEQMVKYDDCLQEMRRLNLKNIESAQEVHKLADTANEKLGQTAEEVETLSVSKIKETTEFSIAGINKTLNESLAKIAEIKENPDSIELLTKDLSEIQSKLEGLFKNLEDYLHTDNVKVYRNVQAAMIEELDKQTTQLKEEQGKQAKNNEMTLFFCDCHYGNQHSESGNYFCQDFGAVLGEGASRKLPRTMAASPYFCRIESKVLSRAASFSREGETGLPLPAAEGKESV